MICPKCGFDSPMSQECTKCGVIFSKIKERQTEPVSEIENTPKTNPWVKIFVVCFLIGLSVGGFSIMRSSRSTTPSAGPPTETTSSEEVGQDSLVSAQDSADFSHEPVVEEFAPEKDNIEERETFAPAPPRYLPSLPTFHSWYNGARGYDSAIEKQKSTGAPLFIYVSVDWCPYCKQVENQILPQYEVKEILKYAIKVKINPEKSDDEKNIAKKLGVTGYPSLFLISEPGARQIKLSSGTAKNGNPKPQDLIDDFREQLSYSWRKNAVDAINNKQSDKAIEVADRILAFESDHPNGDIYHIRGLAFYFKKDFPQAVRDFQLACRAGLQGDCDELKRRGFNTDF